ncbi:hypothetical protein IDG80_00600 [Pelagibacterales bacterium SAG-MED24]|nr:hypothetical protein [Pelagibacterales bacterium SAG-MED24]
MKKIVFRILVATLLLFITILFYLSTIGIKTERFNSKIISQIKQLEPNLELKLNDVSATLDLFNFGINAKTVGTDLIYRDKVIKIQIIESNISIKSLLNGKFALTGISLSTKSLAIKDLITFIRLLNNDPKIFIAKQFIKNGYVIADLKFEFDELGNIKDNYTINGLVKDGQINLLKKYFINKIDFIFQINKNDFKFNDINFILNKKDITIPELIASKQNKEYLISGKLNTKNLSISKNDLNNFVNDDFLKLDINKILLSSKSNFKFKINKNLKIKDLNIKSEIDITNLELKNSLNLKNVFPNIKENILFQNQKIKLEYQKNNLIINGKGEVFLQNEFDRVEYEIIRDKKEIKFESILIIDQNPFEFKLLNYEKKEKSNLELSIQFKKNKNRFIFNKISLKEKDNIFLIKDLILSKNYKIDNFRNFKIDYLDKDNFTNKIQIKKKNSDYVVSGNSFNINSILEKLLDSSDENNSEFFDRDFKLFFDIKKIYLDKNNSTNNLKGFLSLNDNEISELNLESKFSNNKKIKFTIKTQNDEKITTLFSDNAKPLVDRYKFIKGFNEGALDFYSIKKNGETKSQLKIYDFKLKELPALTKVLTLASLQGIADLLSGEGIRFNEFEMNFINKKNLITIDEIYAIGPAISLMLDGYIEKNKLISLRGTLVPATTINKTIGSIPFIGNILVGKKMGEGVFGVSFKIKGPPKNLETTVNPIKTLTPRFITRTLEKIKN